MKTRIGAQKYWLTIFIEKISRTPARKYCLTMFNDQKLTSCNTARRKSRAGAQKYWLRIFSMKISSCVRMKSRLGTQKYCQTIFNGQIIDINLVLERNPEQAHKNIG